MIIPIKCFTCGCVLADKYRYFLEEVGKRKMDAGMDSETSVNYLTKEFKEKSIEGHVLDELGLTKLCCRTKMISHIDIK